MTNLELMICEAENAGEIDLDTRDMMRGIRNESTAQYRARHKADEENHKWCVELQKLDDMKRKFEAEGNKRMANATADKMREIKNKRDEAFHYANTVDPDDNARRSYIQGKHMVPTAKKYSGKSKDPNRMSRYERIINHDIEIGKAYAKKNPWRGNSERDVRQPGYKDLDASQREKIKDIYDKINKSKMKKDKAQELKKELRKMILTGKKRNELNERIDKLSREHESNKEKRNDLLKNTRNTMKESVLEEIYESELNGKITDEERRLLIDYMDM